MFLLGIVGSIFASFMYTLVHSNDSKILTRRSECNNCERKLSWFELIPIISYLYQRGKCNSCKERIPVIYLACEILLALLFLLPVIFQLQFDDFLMYYLLIIFLDPINIVS
ncbi:prepilin peptidase [Aliicoccus persicus]|uniref:Leader peptidase (Prepilin peptidase) / N-methyltransferase/leader peptidase (Prepilin peptidase) / N-methyltransferase n=1 Tax=Aliicoccus persicus TaxID=930138 RepID=A0A662Z3G9_9STAP|nr:leader peptidase (prepilin peptidase) / N-methyltransferase/leader peptidase (prepilin peptidase) / N-methyltransferase [Aliicoccus persicus]